MQDMHVRSAIRKCAGWATCAAVAMLWVFAGTAQHSVSTKDQLRHIQDQRDAARKRVSELESGAQAVARELAEISADLTGAASQSQQLEQQITEADQAIARLTGQSAALAESLDANKKAFRELLAALMVWRTRKPPALATPARSSADAVRAAILMSHAAPAIDQKAKQVSTRIRELADMRSRIRNRKETLAATELILQARRAQIEALAKEKRAAAASLSRQSQIERSRRDALARQASDLQELLHELARRAPTAPRIRPPAPEPKPVPTAKTRTPQTAPAKQKKHRASTRRPKRPMAPANGTLVAGFGQPATAGDARAGVTWQTSKGAQILAPLDGTVEYAGRFRSYGNIVILDVGKGYLVVLAGMEKVYTEEGQTVLSGEPVGHMAARTGPRLYFEVRRNGKPVDPTKWIGQEV